MERSKQVFWIADMQRENDTSTNVMLPT